MLTVGTLNQFYGGSHTLWDLSLDVPQGSCTCLMGRNGMGKTTLLKCIMGLLPVASGTIDFEGRDLGEAMERAGHARALRVGGRLPAIELVEEIDNGQRGGPVVHRGRPTV